MRPRSLRFRIAVRFATLGLGSLAATALGLWLAYSRLGTPEALGPLLAAGAISAFGTLALTGFIWLRFDERIARPIRSLAAAMRVRAHGSVTAPLDTHPARHLGDLGPAAAALAEKLARARSEADDLVAEATARLSAERAQLSAILSEIPVAIMAIGPDDRVCLYDRQCVDLLGDIAPLGLDRRVSEYLHEETLRRARGALDAGGAPYVDAELPTADGLRRVRTRIRPIGTASGYLLSMETEGDVFSERPLVFDFDLLHREPPREIREAALARLSCVVFDTETTGLSPDTDEIVQIGAVRVLNGRRVEGEAFETLVNPGRPIPPSSTRVHRIDDRAVADAPPFAEAARAFARFAGGSVLVAHNAPFDMAFLRRHRLASGVDFDNPVLDTVLLSGAVFGEAAPHSLDAIAERLGVHIAPDSRHTAMGDAIATAEVLLHLLPVLEAAGIRTFGDAVTAMRRHGRLVPDLNA